MDFGNILKQIASAGIQGVSKLIAPKVGSPQEALYANRTSPQTPFNIASLQSGGLQQQPALKDPSFFAGIVQRLHEARQPVVSPLGATANNGPTPTVMPPKPTNTPIPTPKSGGSIPYFDYEPYRVSGNYQPPQPPPDVARSVFAKFEPTKEATKAALTMATENGRFDPHAYNFNSGATGMFANSGDYGPFQINNVTMRDFQRRMPNTMKRIGVNTVEDLKDLKKAMDFAEIIKNAQGWDAWYGPGNRGFDTTR